ncbi:Ubiquitin carboxyl-terminal hydrolase 2 [Komagataella phaffii CBS 7435]|uniref:Ubiquitin carboxyl-terminal hydrolase 2 n=2 Tax=Komagataella phaffii TaxID=460519 RepID=C4R3L1_KOMPG|nr:uncharacterized protein PAS_chr3_0117 [Komagataella phaffii GS115]AOA63942.1 GQ67_03132T0 [Komagataella phaffii]CAH2450215.1 Ubiquitin carboxyl-terminal hydrolase 2 [Komagataella phaffii CBS 7435]AOA68323.1 GQ68_03116T0 [Komagataella phaffii GS115]CAY70048.1 Ubiquitin-specific protease that removes ubiquitin from ubiquitinated proteins, cleaves at the C ter [Komagataella phaffii GS115]CCA40062.1 Ubiquitin carboxyl-terminal hydrolase 2 [Komagataella phaffii CBS 7435]
MPDQVPSASTNVNNPFAQLEAYDFSKSKIFKTSNRLIDDIKNSVLFLEQFSILNLPAVDYATQLSLQYQNRQINESFKLVLLNNQLDFAPTVSTEQLPNGTRTVFRGLIVQDTVHGIPISDIPIYHCRILFKSLENEILCSKHQFFHFSDDSLSPSDRSDLVTDYAKISKGELTDCEDDLKPSIVQSCPKLLDSTNYICRKCYKVLRIEIFEKDLSNEEYKQFELNEIQFRYSKTVSADPSLNISNENDVNKIPSQSECLWTLFKVLRGPLSRDPEELEVKTLDVNHKILNIHLDMDIFEKCLFFHKSADGSYLTPPLFSEYGVFENLVRESYIRKLLEVVYLGTICPNNPGLKRLNQFAQAYWFNDTGSKIFHFLKEFDSTAAIEWFGGLRYDVLERYNPALTTLVSANYFNNKLICGSYSLLCESDPQNTPKYFDALRDIGLLRQAPVVQEFVAKEASKNVFSFRDTMRNYQILGIDTSSADFPTLSDDEILKFYKYELILANSESSYDRLRNALSSIADYRKSEALQNYLRIEPIHNIDQAYKHFDTPQSIEDDVLITAFQFKKDDFPQAVALYDRALLTIAIQRKSLFLWSYITHNLDYLFKVIVASSSKTITGVEDAYKYLGCDPLATDFQVVTIFQERLIKDPGIDVILFFYSLVVIEKSRSSKLIGKFLQNGVVDASFLPLESSPVGLNNIGNTCYLNSLLQYYFVIKPLRTAIQNFKDILPSSEEEFNSIEDYSKRRIGGRTVGYKETERSFQFVYQLRDLFDELIHSRRIAITPTKELAYLAFSPSTDEVQFHLPEVQKPRPSITESETGMSDAPVPELSPVAMDWSSSIAYPEPSSSHHEESAALNSPDESSELIHSPTKRKLSPQPSTEDLNEIDTKVSVTNAEPPTTTLPKRATTAVALIGNDQLENALELGRQQDVTECIENVLFQLESASKPTSLDSDDQEQNDLVKELFYGRTKQILQPVDKETKENITDSSVRTKVERFVSLLVNIGDHPKDLYDALDTYFTEDLIDLDDGQVKRSLTITELPKFLQIQVQRVQFDRERGIPFKALDPLPFHEKLYMDRYLETDNEELILKRKEIFQWKNEISKLNRRKDEILVPSSHSMTPRNALIATKEFLEAQKELPGDIQATESTLITLQKEIDILNSELQTINSRLSELEEKCQHQFDQFKNTGYSIFAIFIHRGEASYGHYWVYIRDPTRNIYRKYNDETITEVPISEVFNFSESNTATPYFLVFVREDLEDEVEPLKRELDSSPTTEDFRISVEELD